MSSKRILWVDNLRGFLILLVVLGHTIQYSMPGFYNSHVFNYIYSFHMPLFFVVSGFVSYKPCERVFWGGIKRRCAQLLIPYLIWTLFFCLVSGTSLIRGYFESPVYWFLIILFFISILITACQRLSFRLKIKPEWICGALAIVLFGIVSVLKPSILSLGILHVHFFFFTLGWFMRKYENGIVRFWMMFPAGIATAALGWFYHMGATPFGLASVPPSIYFLFSGFAGTVFFVTLFKRFANVSMDFFSHIGRLTLGIYVIHIIICGFATNWMQQFVAVNGNIVGVTLLFVLISVATIVVSMLLERSKVTRRLIGLY